jgi:hypothetical protein
MPPWWDACMQRYFLIRATLLEKCSSKVLTLQMSAFAGTWNNSLFFYRRTASGCTLRRCRHARIVELQMPDFSGAFSPSHVGINLIIIGLLNKRVHVWLILPYKSLWRLIPNRPYQDTLVLVFQMHPKKLLSNIDNLQPSSSHCRSTFGGHFINASWSWPRNIFSVYTRSRTTRFEFFDMKFAGHESNEFVSSTDARYFLNRHWPLQHTCSHRWRRAICCNSTKAEYRR